MGGGQAVITTTDLEHVPGAADEGVASLAVMSGQLAEEPVA